MSISNALKGIGGEFEISRVVGFLSGASYCLGALTFTAWNMINGRDFDIVAFCTSFAGGAAIITGGTAGAAAWKDKGVASAKVIETTGTVPTAPPAGPKTPPTDILPIEAEGEGRVDSGG